MGYEKLAINPLSIGTFLGCCGARIFPIPEILLSGSWDKTVKLWQMETGKELLALKGHSDSINCVAISSGGSAIATGSKDKTIKIWKHR
jgi:WD40 repeat protein